MAKDKLRSEVSASRPRDERGHFISVPNIKDAKNSLDKFLISHTGNYKNEEDLLDIRIGNPLRRVISILEEIKAQKAFSFTLKGSLGIAGVALVLSMFGVFGGSQLICDKGVQSQVGVVRVLNYREIYSRPVPIISYVLELVSSPVKQIKNRAILVKADESTINLPFSQEININQFYHRKVIATGSYNSCSRTLMLTSIDSVELY